MGPLLTSRLLWCRRQCATPQQHCHSRPATAPAVHTAYTHLGPGAHLGSPADEEVAMVGVAVHKAPAEDHLVERLAHQLGHRARRSAQPPQALQVGHLDACTTHACPHSARAARRDGSSHWFVGSLGAWQLWPQHELCQKCGQGQGQAQRFRCTSYAGGRGSASQRQPWSRMQEVRVAPGPCVFEPPCRSLLQLDPA